MPVHSEIPAIWLDQKGHAWIDDANVKVIDLALSHLAYGWSAEAIYEQHSYLSLAQIYAALAYFYAHRETIEQAMTAQEEQAAAWRQEFGESSLQRRLRQLKHSR